MEPGPKDDQSYFSDIDNFLQLPMPIVEDEQRQGREIRIWLNVRDKDTKCLEVTGIEKIDSKDYINSNDPDKVNETKRKFLYKTTWHQYSMELLLVYKLGKATSNPTSALLGQKWNVEGGQRFAVF